MILGYLNGLGTLAFGAAIYNIYKIWHMTSGAGLGGVIAPIDLIKSQMKLTGGGDDNGARLDLPAKPGDEKLASAIDAESSIKTLSLPGDAKGQPAGQPKDGKRIVL